MVRLAPGLVRIPDLAFISWQRLPERRVPTDPIPGLVPDLVVEVLSDGNTAAEMDRKRREYFAAGVRLAWFVDPVARTVEVYTAANQSTLLEAEQTLDGGKPDFLCPWLSCLPSLIAKVSLERLFVCSMLATSLPYTAAPLSTLLSVNRSHHAIPSATLRHDRKKPVSPFLSPSSACLGAGGNAFL